MEGMELALAATIAGGVFLGIEPSPQNLKLALRHGACNFMVNTLDEALRVLKNELRKRAPVAVGLLGNATQILPAIVERGVQPDFLADTSELMDRANYLDSGYSPGATPVEGEKPAAVEPAIAAYLAAFSRLADRGAVTIDLSGKLAMVFREHDSQLAEKIVNASHRIPIYIEDLQLQTVAEAANLPDLRQFDEFLTTLLPENDWIRRTWLAEAPACFHRQIPLRRVIGLHPNEIAALLAEDRSQRLRETLTAAMLVRWVDAAGNAQNAILEPLR